MRRTLAALRRSPLAPLLLLAAIAAIAACSGIITGPDAGPDTRPRSIRVTPTALDLTLGQTATLTARLYDVTGTETAPEPGRSITFASANEAIATVTPGGEVIPVADGTVLVRAEYGVLALGVPVRVLARPRLVIVDGDLQTAEQGDSLPRRLIVRALDATGQPVNDVPVTFSVTTGGGTVSQADIRTVITGAAQALWTLGLPLGTQTVRVTAVGYDAVDFSATATPGTRPVRIGLASARSTLIGAADTESIVGVVYNVANVVLGAAPITWSSSFPAVATVDQAGVVTAVAPGATFIRAVSGAARDSVRIDVLALPVIAVAPATLAFTTDAGSSPAATTVSVNNTGGSVLSGLTAGVAYGAGATGWLGVALDAATAPATLTVTPATTALAAGVYTATITIASTVPRVVSRTVGVTLTVSTVVPVPKLALGADNAHPAGLQDERTLTLPAPATSAVTITLRSAAASNVLLAPDATTAGSASITLSVAAGASTASYWIQGVEGSVGGVAPLIAEAAGFTPDTAQVTVTRPALALVLVSASTSPAVGGDDPVLRVTIGANESGVLRPLAVRAFGSPALVSVLANAPAIAQLRFTATAATEGVDQGPATRVDFRLRPGRSATLLADAVGGVPASLSVARSGVAGAASFSVTSEGNSYQQLGTDPTLTLTAPPVPVIAVAPGAIALNVTEGATSPAPSTVSITNSGGGTLSGLGVSVAYGAGATGWLALALDQTAAPATLTVTPSTTAVPAGSYSAAITIASSVAGVAPVDIVVSLTVAASVLPKLDLGADLGHPAGLMAASTVTVPATAAADVSVTLRSLDATAALISADADVAGAVNGVVQLAAGTTAATWFLHGVEGASGRVVTIVAEAAGYRPDTLVVSIERPLVLLGQRGDNTVPATGGEDPVLDVTVGGLVSGGLFAPMRVRPGGIAPEFTLSSNTAATALLRHVATPFTLGADQGPAASITFSVAPGRQATSIGDVPGVAASLRLARTGTAGLASVSIVSQPAEYAVAGSGSVAFTLTGTAALPRVVIVSGNAQAVAWDQIVPDSLVVRLLDGNDAPVSGVTVDFTVSANGGTLSPTSAVTDASGLVATQWRMSTALGAHTVSAGAAGFGSVTFDGTSLGGTVVTRVAITAGRTTLAGGPGDRETFTATAFNLADSIITSRPIVWTSSAPSIVRVDSAGNVFALAVGQASIRAAVELVSAEVLVTVPANTWVTLGARAYTAAGLMREVVETFAAPAPVAFFLTLRSADPTRALVSASSNNVGTTSTTLLVAAGTTTVRWWLHGLEGLAGDTVSVTAESNGFTVDTTLVTVVPPLMRIGAAGNLALPASGGRDPWFAVTIGGEVEPVGASLAFVELPVRAGAPPPLFVLSSSNAAVAELRFRPTPNTSGVAQGPATAVTFGIAAGFSGTYFPGYDSGELPSLEMSRPGGAGTASIQLAGPAGYLLDGIEPLVSTVPIGPPAISLALVGTPLLGVNGSATVRATLAQPAPLGGVAVTLVSGDVGRATVDAPSTVTIAAGATTADYVIRGVTPGSVTLTASASGYADGTLSVGVSVLAISVPLNLNVPFTQTTSLPITLPQAAPVGGTTVTVTSADPSTVLVLTPTVVIPAGAVSGNAQLQGLRLGVAVVSAAVPNVVTGNTNVRVTAVLDIVESTLSMNRGFSVARFTTRLLSNGAPFAAPTGGIPLTFVARNAACVAAPGGATIAAGQNSILSVADYGGTAPLSCTTFVVVSSPQFDPDSVLITVDPQPTSSMSVNATIGAGLSVQSSVTLGVAAPAGGTTVTITSSDPTRLVLSPDAATIGTASIDIFVPTGGSFVPFWVSGIEGQGGTATVAAATPGYVAPAPRVVTVNPIGIELFGNTSLTTLGGDGGGSVFVGELDPPGPTQRVRSEAVIRAGGQPLTITLTSSAPGVLLPVVGGVAASPGTVTIAAGASRANYGIRPLSSGTGVISATSTGAGTPVRADYPAPITVTQPGSTLALSTTIAAGLARQGTISLGNGAPAGGVTVTISSSDAARLVVAANGTTVGSASADIFVQAGFTQATFWYSAIEGQQGTTAQITASMVGGLFAPPTPITVTVNPIGIELFGNTSLTTLGGDGGGSVYVGELDPPGPAQRVNSEAVIRAGGQPLTITLTSSAPGVLLPVVGGAAASPGTVTIAVGASRANYGIRPLSAGTGVISATSTGAGSPVRADYPAPITVTQPTSTIALNPSLAAGLSRQGFLSLGNPAPAGGVTVTISSSDAARLVVAANGTTVGTGSTDIVVAAGFTQATFWYSAIEGQGGTTAQVSAVVQGGQFANPTPIAVNIGELGVEAFGTTTLTTLGQDGSGLVYLGTLGAAGPSQSVASEAVIRAGGQSVTVTLTSSAPSVAVPVVAGVAASPRTVTILPGESRANYAIRPITAGTATISATAPNATAPARAGYPTVITVTSPTTSLVMDQRVGAGLASNNGSVTLQVGAPAGGVTVRLTSSDPTRLLLAPNLLTAGAASIDLFIPQGGSFASFTAMGLEDVTGNPTVTAQTPGYTDATASTAVEPIGVQWFGVSTLRTLDGDGSGAVYVGVASGTAGNRTITPEQIIRIGGVARTITITSSDPSVLLPVFGGVAQQDLSVTILPGQSRATVNVRPVGPGTATISPTGAGLLPAQTASIPQAVTVTVPTQSLSATFVQGSGLAQTVFLNLASPVPTGGRTLTLTSSDPTRLLVAPDAATGGAGEITVAIAQGFSNRSFVLMAPEGVTGPVTLLASIPGYRDTTFTFTVVQPAVTLNGPVGARSIAQGDEAFQAVVGIPAGDNVSAQFVRFGAPAALVVTLTSSVPAVGTLVVGGVAGSPRTVQISPGQSISPSLAGTGANFRPLSAGNTTITATIPGYLQQNNAIRTVVVSP